MMAEENKRIKTNMGGMKPEKFKKLLDNGGHRQYMFNTLQRNNGNGTFSELAQLAGVSSTDWSWTPLFADFDNDGYKDLFVTNGVKNNNRESDLSAKYKKRLDSLRILAKQRGIPPEKFIGIMKFFDIATTDKLPNYIYKNNGDLTFTKKIKEWGMEIPTLSNGAAFADFDLDGDLDLVINNIDDNATLYKNNTVEKKIGNYIRFQLFNEHKKTYFGTKITLYQAGKLWQMNCLSNTRGYMSKSEDVMHFGVGEKQNIEKVEILWPDGKRQTLLNLEVNKVYDVYKSQALEIRVAKAAFRDPIFKEATTVLALGAVKHQENEYDDYAKEILLPHKMSQFGPCIGVGDVNGDGLQDFFQGAAAGYSGSMFIQNKKGTFDKVEKGAWTQDKASEDMGIAFLDIDGDKDLDLFIVSGGNEFEVGSVELQDRLYINNGKGKFSKQKKRLPEYLTSGSCIVPKDFDKDGDIDLFIGGRLLPQKYPHPATSHLLENRDGVFIDVTKEKSAEFVDLGMVTSASWLDYNNDGLEDLVVVGEWMPITVFEQTQEGKFIKAKIRGLEDSEGWYYSMQTEDMDMDGDKDIIVGNLGLNYKYKASVNEPFEVYSYDFDQNGSLDIVLSYYQKGISFPLRGKSCSLQQIPSLETKFKTFNDFGNSDLRDVYGSSLEAALNLKAKTFASAYIENKGDGSFSMQALPLLSQVSSVNSILTEDYDGDGNKDLLLVGNLYASEIETPRNDAGTGLYLKGDGRGNFSPVSILESGFYTPHDAKAMEVIKVGDKKIILVANNNDFLQAIEHNQSASN